MPSDLFLKVGNTVHRTLLAVSGDRVLRSFKGMPTLELTTTGRKSGQPRSVMLTTPLRDGDAYVIVASRGGDDTHPAWFHNLCADPHVRVRIVGEPERPMRARVANSEERARLWPQVVAKHSGYGGYQKRTQREIPLVLLEP